MDKSKIYLDLSKCIGEELKNIYTILGDTLKFESPSIVFNFPIMHYHEGMWIRTNFFQDKAKEDNFLADKTELTYPEFIKLFEGGETSAENSEVERIRRSAIENLVLMEIDKKMEHLKEIEVARTEGILTGLKICKEMWAQGTISHENIQEEIYYYQEELDCLNSNQ